MSDSQADQLPTNSEPPAYSTFDVRLDQGGHPHPVLASTGSSSSKKRKMSRVKTSPTVKRSASQPQLNISDAEDPGDSPSSASRRNKLGYQRISIACGHCRRRKIRCVPAEDEQEARCANCIRLKKECVYLPVEATETPGNLKTSLGSTSSSVISASPSDLSAGRSLDQRRDFGHFIPLGSNAPHDFALGGAIPVAGNAPTIQAPDYGYTREVESRSPWNPTYPPHTEAPSAAPAFWGRQGERSPMGDYSPFPTNSQQYMHHHSAPNQQEYSYIPQHSDNGIAPQRSLSYTNIAERLPGIHYTQGLPSSRDTYGRQDSLIYPPPVDTGIPSSGAPEAKSAPVGTNPYAPTASHQWQQPYYQDHQQYAVPISQPELHSQQWYHPSHNQAHAPLEQPYTSPYTSGPQQPG